MQYTLHFTLL